MPEAAKAKSKRYRPCGPPFHEVLYGQSGRSLRVKLDEPEDGQECPLTLAPVAEDRLECLSEQARWYPAFPDVKRATLSCGHSFGALNILYHFARRNMRCPCCRAGFDSRLTISCIPPNFRQTLSVKVEDELREDRSEQIAIDGALALEAQQRLILDARTYRLLAETTHMLLEARRAASMLLRARFMGESDSDAVTIEVPLQYAGSGGETVFSLPNGAFTQLIESQFRDPIVRAFTFAVHLSCDGVEANLLVAQTDRVSLDRSRRSSPLCIPSLNSTSFFDVDLQWSFDELRLTRLTWRSPAPPAESQALSTLSDVVTEWGSVSFSVITTVL